MPPMYLYFGDVMATDTHMIFIIFENVTQH